MMLKIGHFGKVDQKYLGSTEVCCWRRIEISWTDRLRNEEVLLRVKEERNIIHTIKRRKGNLTGHILRRNWIVKQIKEGKTKESIEMKERR
jgi:hypothetical protein